VVKRPAEEGRARKMKTIVVIALVVLALVVVGPAAVKLTASDMSPVNGEFSEEGLVGKTVKTASGDYLGKISGIVPGPEGQEAFAVVTYQVRDDTRSRIPVPVSALSCGDAGCTVNGGKRTMETAPDFFTDNELSRQRMAQDVYRHFGVAPYWTEKETGK
jgi:hypothetical protein